MKSQKVSVKVVGARERAGQRAMLEGGNCALWVPFVLTRQRPRPLLMLHRLLQFPNERG